MNRLRFLTSLAGMMLAIVAATPAIADADELPFGLIPGSFSTELSTHQAGAHPDLRTRFEFNREGDFPAGGSAKDLSLILPKGLIGDPTATPTCPIAVVVLNESPCPRDTAVGSAVVQVTVGGPFFQKKLIYNIPPYPGEPAAFAMNPLFPVRIDTHVRADGDYGITVSSNDITEAGAVLAADITLWGVPADHNGSGPETTGPFTPSFGGPSGEPRVPLLTNPSECSGTPLTSSFRADSWLHPGDFTTPVTYDMGAITGCEKPEFSPTIDAQPTTNLADAPSGLDFKLHLPQKNGPFEGADEVQMLTAGFFAAGQFRLGFGADKTGATGSGDLTESSTVVAGLDTAAGAFLPGEEISGAGIPAGTTIASIGTGTLTLSQSATATGAAVDLSADLPPNPSAAIVQSALEALPSIGAGNISVYRGTNVLGSVSGPLYSFTFQGDLAESDVEQLSAEALDGGLANMSTLRDGHPGTPSEEIATAELRDAVVRLPAGMSINPSSANGLEACSLAQVGISASGQSDGKAQNCPLASKLGTVEAISPAIDHKLGGALYLAAQNENPFGSLLATYLVVEDLKSGINVKLAGKVDPDPSSGQLTVSFRNNPQLPIEDINLHLFEGNRAALRTPSACGTHTTTATLTPWTAPEGKDATPSSSFALTGEPNGGACLPNGAGAPNKPAFSAGTMTPTAKAFSPFVLKLAREDGSQPFKVIETTLPKGLLGKLAGVPYCSDAALASISTAEGTGAAERAHPSCPAASRIGINTAAVGAGTDPFFIDAPVYLSGPYKGAPLSIAIVTPALAGPFDLGNVVVRAALRVNPESSQVTAVTDPLPSIIHGIPLDIRSIETRLDKPDFTLNPTNCSPMSVGGSLLSTTGASAALDNPFQVGDCARLGFKPSLAIKLKGGTKRSDHPALTAVLKARPGDANIAKTSVALPHSEFLAQDHIRTVCTRVQFSAGAGNGAGCPKGSIYGKASAITPLLDQPLKGPVYLRSSDNPLPDLVVALHGQIDFNLVGRIDSKNGGIRTSFESVPDAPVTKFVLQMQGGQKGLLENSRNLCKSVNKASVAYAAQNGDGYTASPVLGNGCRGKGKKKGGKHRGNG